MDKLIRLLLIFAMSTFRSTYANYSSEATPPALVKIPLIQAPPLSAKSGGTGPPLPILSESCNADNVHFELATGYVLSAPGNVLDSVPGTLMLSDCLESCQVNDSCRAVNYETGLCVLFSTNADVMPDALAKSQFPVFTIYAQKMCLKSRSLLPACEQRAWSVDRVRHHKLSGYEKKQQPATSRLHCAELCIMEEGFPCRSASYNEKTNICELSDMDRTTLMGRKSLERADDYDYLENNCIEKPKKMCEFKKLPSRILKTVDSVYQDVGSVDECRELCLSSPYRCRSFDYGDTGEMVCRLSHHSRTTLTDIQDPYLDVPEATTYELSSCYNVSIDCRSGDVMVRIQTNKIFDGKVYAKGSPNSCVQDINNSLEFDLEMGYDNLECNVKKQGLGKYFNEIVIQHHDKIVTSSDLGLAISCNYDLTNKSVSNEVDLGVQGNFETVLSEDVTVESPNVIMKIESRSGDDLNSASVGDPLTLRFEILDLDSPYEIFVRELIAMDGADSSEIVLIDANGCPVDDLIIGPVLKSLQSPKILLTHFDAFKFPSSDVVQFRALITPCMPSCTPVQCRQGDDTEPRSDSHALLSYGRRRRRRSVDQSPPNDWTLVQTIKIVDKLFENNGSLPLNEGAFVSTKFFGVCMESHEIALSGAVFLFAEAFVILMWAFMWKRKQTDKLREQFAHGIQKGSNAMSSSSVSELYGSDFARNF
ncbi:uncharacterized protein LOC108734666 [Agrilus planipennis]|uniref:Uncharacterized protein LOC108734666 n=1 Tax=Agrilus planipennis TaxID=224129 RepID=A0A1W4WCW5_AGRPL|nr:uncharacterized protein LOC108734666 [Agrilus planipennis]